MADTPRPLVPPDVDLRGLEYMPYYGDRLRESGLNSRATDAEYRAAHNLWWSAWKQVPAASLPTDDVELCKLADLGRDQRTWAKVKTSALHGFVLCSDGRLYHPVLAAIALEVWESRQRASVKGSHGASKRWEKHRQLKQMAQALPVDSTGNACATKNDGREVKRSEDKKVLGLSISPTRVPAKVKTVLKTIPEDQNPELIERNRRMSVALAAGDKDLAERIKAGMA